MKKQIRTSQSGIYTDQFTVEFTRQLAKFQKSKGEVIIAGDYDTALYRLAKNKQQTKNYGILRFHT